MMDTKEATLRFYYSERLKSNILLVEKGLEKLSKLKGDELQGGKEVLRGVFEGLKTEIGISRRYLSSKELDLAETSLMEAEGNIELHDYEKARACLARGLSQITTISAKYIDSI